MPTRAIEYVANFRQTSPTPGYVGTKAFIGSGNVVITEGTSAKNFRFVISENGTSFMTVNDGTYRNRIYNVVFQDSQLSAKVSYSSEIQSMTGTLADDGSSLYDVTFYDYMGEPSDEVVNNGNLVFSSVPYIWNMEYVDNAALQADLARWYGTPWTKDTVNSNRLILNTTQPVQGENSVQIRTYTSDRFRVTLNEDLSDPIQVKRMTFWIRNNTGATITPRIFIYRGTSLNNHIEVYPQESSTINSDNTWRVIDVSFTAQNMYNFAIFFPGGLNITNPNNLCIDYIAFNN